MTDENLEIITNTVDRIKETVQSAKSNVDHMAILPGGEIGSETANKLDRLADETRDMLADIDFALAVMVAAVKNL